MDALIDEYLRRPELKCFWKPLADASPIEKITELVYNCEFKKLSYATCRLACDGFSLNCGSYMKKE